MSGSDLNAKFANFEEMLEKVSVLDDHEDDMNLGERDVVENYGMVGVHMPALPTAESLFLLAGLSHHSALGAGVGLLTGHTPRRVGYRSCEACPRASGGQNREKGTRFLTVVADDAIISQPCCKTGGTG